MRIIFELLDCLSFTPYYIFPLTHLLLLLHFSHRKHLLLCFSLWTLDSRNLKFRRHLLLFLFFLIKLFLGDQLIIQRSLVHQARLELGLEELIALVYRGEVHKGLREIKFQKGFERSKLRGLKKVQEA